MMANEDVKKLLSKLALPAITAMLVNAIYNIVDTLFVGMLKNTSAIGAVSVVFPIFILVAAIGQMFGIGGGSYISRLMGENNKEKANTVATTSYVSGMAVGLLFTFLGNMYLEPMLRLFGATDTIMPYAIDYGRILVFGSVFTIMNMTLNNMIRAEGNAKYSMFAISLGAVLNIILDPIFMFTMGMGLKGASAATVVAQIISFVFLNAYYFRGKSIIKIRLKDFRMSFEIYSQILKIGLATFARQALSSVSLGFINTAAAAYSDGAVAAMGISLRVVSFAMFVVFGYNQGFQPVAGYSYGSGRMDRLKEAISVSLRWTSIFSALTSVMFIAFARPIVSMFSSDPEVISVGAKAIRYISVMFPLFGFQQVYSVLFQAIGKGKEAIILSVARQGLFLMPAIIVLPKLFGLDGVLLSQPVADFLTIILTAVLALKLNNEIGFKVRQKKALAS